MNTNPAVSVLLREKAQISEQIKSLRIQLRAIDDAITQLSGGESVVKHTRRALGPTLADRVLDVLRESADGMTPQEIADKLTEMGRATGNTTVSSILSRLKKASLAKKYDKRWYVESEEPPEGGSTEDEVTEGAGSREVPRKLSPTSSTLVSSTSTSGLLAGIPKVPLPPPIPLPGKKGG